MNGLFVALLVCIGVVAVCRGAVSFLKFKYDIIRNHNGDYYQKDEDGNYRRMRG